MVDLVAFVPIPIHLRIYVSMGKPEITDRPSSPYHPTYSPFSSDLLWSLIRTDLDRNGCKTNLSENKILWVFKDLYFTQKLKFGKNRKWSILNHDRYIFNHVIAFLTKKGIFSTENGIVIIFFFFEKLFKTKRIFDQLNSRQKYQILIFYLFLIL